MDDPPSIESQVGKRGPDTIKRKKREYCVTVRMQIKLPIAMAKWVREQSGGRVSKLIIDLVYREMLRLRGK